MSGCMFGSMVHHDVGQLTAWWVHAMDHSPVGALLSNEALPEVDALACVTLQSGSE